MQHLFIKTTQKLRKSVKNCQLQSNTATFFYGPQCLKYNDTVTKVVYENKPAIRLRFYALYKCTLD